MKSKFIFCFHSAISNEIADYKTWQDVAMLSVRLHNTNLGERYPSEFFYLKCKTKKGIAYYAGSVADPSQWDDPKIVKVLGPEIQLPDNPGHIKK